MNAIADGLTRNALFQELNRRLTNPLARRALRYADKQPELLYLAVCVLQLAHVDTPPAVGRLGPDLLKGLVRIDCAFFHFADEWCRVYSVGEDVATCRIRAALVTHLAAALRDACRKQPAAGKPPAPASARQGHRCWSLPAPRMKPAAGVRLSVAAQGISRGAAARLPRA